QEALRVLPGADVARGAGRGDRVGLAPLLLAPLDRAPDVRLARGDMVEPAPERGLLPGASPLPRAGMGPRRGPCALERRQRLVAPRLEDEHLRGRPALILLRRRIHAVSARIDSEAVDPRLDRDVHELSDVPWVIHLEHRDESARARDIDAAE